VSDVIDKLFEVIKARRIDDSSDSYVASLHRKGINKILEKVGEEAVETIIAAKDSASSGNNAEVIQETTDLWFHTLIMLDHLGETPTSIYAELERRFGTSGITEKESRNT
jgi:phosphoribosyl-ATP pyrophosphohydrolase